MCLAKAYVGRGSSEELILEDITMLQFQDGKIQLRTLFGEQKEVQGIVKEVDFQGSRILVEKQG